MITLKKLHFSYLEWLGYGLLSVAMVLFMTRRGISLSFDSINYLSVAKTIGLGRWTDSLVGTWPPFYPLLIALLNSLGFLGEESARIISMIMYSALVIMIFLLAKATAGRLVAHLASVSMLLCAPLLFVYSHCWSETVYVAVSAISLLVLQSYYKSTGVRSMRLLLWAAAFVGLALLTRYIGVALLLAGLLIVLLKKEIRVSIDKIKALILFGVIACAPLAIYLMSCYHYRNRLPGYGHRAMPSLWENTVSFLSTTYHDLLTFELRFADAKLFPYLISWQPGIVIPVLGKITGVIFLLLLITYFSLRSYRHTSGSLIVAVTYVVCYSLSLIFLTSTFVPISLATRFCVPIYPFIIVLVFAVIIRTCKSAAQRKTKFLVWGASIVVVLSFWSIQLGSSVNLYLQRFPIETPMVGQQDITGDGVFDVSDIMYLTSYLYKGGPPPRPLENADVNCDATVNAGDVVFLIGYIYRGGPSPCNLEDR
jgi:4-amino-4-deoxy-L-arabinose transferase-like glycosyltransferase